MHRPALRLLAALLLALVVLPLSAVAAHAATYTITGKVVGYAADGTTVVPLAGVYVTAHDEAGTYPSPGGWTGADGTYTFHPAGGGPFQLKATCDARIAGDNCQDFATEWYGGFSTDAAASSPEFTVADGVDTVANFQLDRLATVMGRVVDGAGQPVPGLQVESWAQVEPEMVSTSTDAGGYYTLDRVDPHADQIIVRDPDDNWQTTTVQAPIAPGPAVTTIDAVVQPYLEYTAVPDPTISGTTTVGTTLTANPGAWSPEPAADDFGYQWYRVSSTGAVTSVDGYEKTYALTAADAGYRMQVEVTSFQAGYRYTSRTSAPSAVVLAPFTTAPVPTISGTKAVGYTLTANHGTWSPAPDTFSYQWYRSGSAISGATASTYKLTSYDKGKAITVRVTGRKSGYVTTSKTSVATSAVLGVYSTVPTPTISGTKKVGYTLTANHGTWSPAPTSYRYQWYRGTTAISGATYRTYKLTSYDKGKVVKVKVTPVLSGYYSPGKYSAGYTIY